MFVEGSPVLARCPLDKGSPGSAEVFLTTQGIVIRRRDRTVSRFGRSEINLLRTRHRILWLPLVLGGIITPLALVALIKTFGSFWLLFTTVLAGIFLMYYGYTGTDAFTVSTRVKEYDFFISKITPHLRAFIGFANMQLQNDDPNIYISLSEKEWESFTEVNEVPEGHRIYLSRKDVPQAGKLLALNARDVEVSLRFEADEDTGLVLTFLQRPLPCSLFNEVE